MTTATCIGCGCDDFHACGEGCYWLRVDYEEGKGVCSECDEHEAAWDQGDRIMHAEPTSEREAIAEGLFRIESTERAPRKTAAGGCDHDWPYEDVRDTDRCRHCGMSFLRHVFVECE